MNYELIYKARKAGMKAESPSNIKVGFIQEAEKKAAAAIKIQDEWLKRNLPKDTEFEISSYVCMADGVINHVFCWQGNAPKGAGKRVCCFCGCDDFDD